MLKIGDFSRISQVTIKTLRHYDRLGLLKPAHVDKFTGHRYYTMDQIKHLNQIVVFKEIGMTLKEIQMIFNGDLSSSEIRGMLRLKRARLKADIEAAEIRLQRIETHIYQLDEVNKMPEYNVVIKALPEQYALTVRQTVDSADEITLLFDDIKLILERIQIESTAAWGVLYHHDGFRDIDLDIEIVIPVAEHIKDNIVIDENHLLKISKISAWEQAAMVIENGHNENWSGSYQALGQFIEANGYDIAGAVREVYLTSPDDDAGWLVEIQFPVKRQ